MSQRFVITGTDTGIGKTVFAAALTQALGASYWKPVQAGDTPTDTEIITSLTSARVIAEAYRLRLPASPHAAAAAEDLTIDPDHLALPDIDGPLVVEGAGGLLVPLTGTHVFADIFQQWQIPVIVCARTALGTINHSLLTLEALARRGIPILGIAFIGDAAPSSETAILDISGVKRLGRLPKLDPLNTATLADAFAANFDLADFV